MKYEISCGDLKYNAESKKDVVMIVRDLVLPFIQISADIKITKITTQKECELSIPTLFKSKIISDRPDMFNSFIKRSGVKLQKRGKK